MALRVRIEVMSCLSTQLVHRLCWCLLSCLLLLALISPVSEDFQAPVMYFLGTTVRDSAPVNPEFPESGRFQGFFPGNKGRKLKFWILYHYCRVSA